MFYRVMWQSALLLTAVTVLRSLVTLVSNLLAIRTRCRISTNLQNHYLNCSEPNNAHPHFTFYQLYLRKPNIDNPYDWLLQWSVSLTHSWVLCRDQRIAQDVADFALAVSAVIARLVLTPFVIAFYTYFTYTKMGWQGPVFIYAFFVVGAVGCTCVFFGTVSHFDFVRWSTSSSCHRLYPLCSCKRNWKECIATHTPQCEPTLRQLRLFAYVSRLSSSGFLLMRDSRGMSVKESAFPTILML